MLKSTPPQQTPKGNANKYRRYREAWTRIKKAKDDEYYFEAVTLEESIICDRLISYLVSRGVTCADNKYLSFENLICEWERVTGGIPISEGNISNLQESVCEWKQLRNEVVHGMVKSCPDTELDDIQSFMEEARRAAEEGEKLARAVDNWQKKVKK
jgi:hypothetical protein